MYTAIIAPLKNVRKHPNADRVQLATCLGSQVVVGLDCSEGDLGVYFPSDGQLSEEFCRANNLYRHAELNSDPSKSGMFEDTRRVRVQKFRGEESDGIWLPLECLSYLPGIQKFDEGFEFTRISGQEVCCKYIPNRGAAKAGPSKAKKVPTSHMFKEHFDTEHLSRHMGDIPKGALVIITEKLHGTSHRVGHVQVERKLSWLEKAAQWLGVKVQDKEWKYLSGTRRVVLGEHTKQQYHDPAIRSRVSDAFYGLLHKGETVYLEIVGYEPSGKPIMPPVDATRSDVKEVQAYGKTMHYSYGCPVGHCDFYVYRITHTNEDGHSVDLSWEVVRTRCGEMGVKHVPELRTFFTLQANDNRLEETLTHSTVGSHISEGSCVRVEGGHRPQIYKNKTYTFKLLEDISKGSASEPDMEEAQDLLA